MSEVQGIMAGDETAWPPDAPSARLDILGSDSPFNAVGSLAISAGGFSFKGSATALSPNWVLTAGHNLDLNDDGLPDADLSVDFNLPGFGTYAASSFHACPGFTGFGNPSIHRDLGLIYFANPLPTALCFSSLSSSLELGDEITLVGFGQSGYGNYGYTTDASLADRRIGYNVVDSFNPDDVDGGFPALFDYDFDIPDTVGQVNGSLGNDLESLIGPGDSGGPVLIPLGTGYAIAGVSTFTEGYGGRFGDIGGGVLIGPHLDWITTTMAIPEPSSLVLMLLGAVALLGAARRAQGR